MATITEDYVSFEVAKLLKEKGFDVPCLAHWYIGKETYFSISREPQNWNVIKTDLDWLSCPTLQMAMKWLRAVYGVYIEIPIVGMEWESPTKWYYGWRCQTKDVIDRPRSKDANYPTYEQAVEAALKYSLENLI